MIGTDWLMPEVRAPSQPIMWPERGKGAVKLCQSIRGIPAGFIPPETSEYSPEGRRMGWGGGRFTIELGKRGSHATKATIERERHHFLKKKKKKPIKCPSVSKLVAYFKEKWCSMKNTVNSDTTRPVTKALPRDWSVQEPAASRALPVEI